MTTWKDELPEDLQAAPALQDVQDVSALAKQFVDLQSHLGNSIRIPGENATDQDRQVFYDKLVAKVPDLLPRPKPGDELGFNALLDALGRPKTADEYALPEVPDLEVSDDKRKFWQNLAHGAGLTPDQFSKILKPLMEQEATSALTANKELRDGLASLKEEWGNAFERKVGNIKLLLDQVKAPKALVEQLNSNTMHPAMLSMLDRFAEAIGGESSELQMQGPGGGDSITTSEAAIRAAEIRKRLTTDRSLSPNSKEYRALVDEMVRYEGLANPGASKEIKDLRAGFSSRF